MRTSCLWDELNLSQDTQYIVMRLASSNLQYCSLCCSRYEHEQVSLYVSETWFIQSDKTLAPLLTSSSSLRFITDLVSRVWNKHSKVLVSLNSTDLCWQQPSKNVVKMSEMLWWSCCVWWLSTSAETSQQLRLTSFTSSSELSDFILLNSTLQTSWRWWWWCRYYMEGDDVMMVQFLNTVIIVSLIRTSSFNWEYYIIAGFIVWL